QSSPQSLRIDNIDLRRHPLEEKVSADMDITRIITAGMSGDITTTSDTIELSLDPVDWNCSGGSLTPQQDAEKKTTCLIAEASQDTMELAFVRSFKPGEKWLLEIDIAVKGNAWLTLSSPDNITFDGKETLKNDGKKYHYKISMTLPKIKNDRIRIRIPHLIVKGNGSKIYIYNGKITKVG
ncbi:MAG: hypothetical protein LDL53_04285, partial [Candidatus Hydrogenedens sp.]|nr:hypothetical protein [Candidatus Hydrogenedens sp.]